MDSSEVELIVRYAGLEAFALRFPCDLAAAAERVRANRRDLVLPKGLTELTEPAHTFSAVRPRDG